MLEIHDACLDEKENVAQCSQQYQGIESLLESLLEHRAKDIGDRESYMKLEEVIKEVHEVGIRLGRQCFFPGSR